MKHKKIFATIVAIACTLMLATGCSVTPHEDVMKSDSTTIEQSDKADSKDVQKDESDKASDKKSDEKASADKKSDKDANKESSTSADKSDSKSDSSASKPSGNSSSSHSGSSASKPFGNTGSNKPSSGNSGSNSGSTSTPTPEPSQPAHQHSYTSSITTQPTCSTPGVRNYTCVSGDDSYTESIPATGHNWVDNVETVEHSDPIWKVICNGCGAQFDDAHEAGLHVAAVFGDACSSTSNQIVGYNTYSETVSHGQICKVCGATK